jgi:hypothetical protein
MINLRLKIKRGDLLPFADSIELTVGEHLHDLHYLDFYNLRWLVHKLREKSTSINIYDPFRAAPARALSLKLNLNVANSYVKLMQKNSVVWEDQYLSALHYEALQSIDRQIKNLDKIV